MAAPLHHHRSPRLQGAATARCCASSKHVFRTEHDVLLFTASGTGAFESAFANLLSPGDRVLCVTAGNFGDRWIAMARAYGADVAALDCEPWGERARPGRRAPRRGRRDAAARRRRALRDLDRRRRRHPRDRRARARPPARCSWSTPSRASARCRVETDAWGARRRRLGLAEGADDARPASRSRASSRARLGAQPSGRRRRASTSTGSARSTRRTKAADAVHARDRPWSPGSTPRSTMIERRGPRRPSGRATGELGRAAPRRAPRRWGSSCSRPTTTSCSLVTAVPCPRASTASERPPGARDRYGIVVAGGQGPLAGKVCGSATWATWTASTSSPRCGAGAGAGDLGYARRRRAAAPAMSAAATACVAEAHAPSPSLGCWSPSRSPRRRRAAVDRFDVDVELDIAADGCCDRIADSDALVVRSADAGRRRADRRARRGCA